MREVRLRALTLEREWLIVVVLADVEMREARLRALTHTIFSFYSLFSLVEMREARLRALTGKKAIHEGQENSDFMNRFLRIINEQ